MRSEINFVTVQKQIISPSEAAKIQKARYFAFGSLFIVALLSIMLFIGIAFSPLDSLKNEENTLLSTITGMHDKYTKMLLLNQRVTEISQLLNTRPSYDKTIDSLLKQAPTSVSLQSVNINNGTMTAKVISSSLDDINTFLTNVQTNDKTKFKKIVITDVDLIQDQAVYACTLTVTL